MLSFIIFLLSTLGATFIVTQSYLFKNIRKKACDLSPNFFGKLISCNQCAGFYIALVVQFIILLKEREQFIFYFSDLYYILYGFIGSFICYLVYTLIKHLIEKHD